MGVEDVTGATEAEAPAGDVARCSPPECKGGAEAAEEAEEEEEEEEAEEAVAEEEVQGAEAAVAAVGRVSAIVLSLLGDGFAGGKVMSGTCPRRVRDTPAGRRRLARSKANAGGAAEWGVAVQRSPPPSPPLVLPSMPPAPPPPEVVFVSPELAGWGSVGGLGAMVAHLAAGRAPVKSGSSHLRL